VKLELSVKDTLEGPISIGTVTLIRVIQKNFGLGLAEAKNLIDKAVFGGETIEVVIPNGLNVERMISEIAQIETSGEICTKVLP
jgi:hypothetical protein